AIRKFPGSKIEVSGHTDATGSAETNLQLSKNREKNVADFLINCGHVKRGDITVMGRWTYPLKRSHPFEI
ncbi:MAG: OmpA family protein, partial [Deltaproteobacteria bacterium]|nr:OmpA family protein [Deltaproteobacteria bacterium]